MQTGSGRRQLKSEITVSTRVETNRLRHQEYDMDQNRPAIILSISPQKAQKKEGESVSETVGGNRYLFSSDILDGFPIRK